MVALLFNFLSIIISAYIMICFVRVFLTWIPSIQFSRFGSFLSMICDPYLNLFRKIRFLRFNGIDFTPVIAIGALSALSSIFSSIASLKQVSVGIILAIILNMAWSIVASLGGFLAILMIIRLIFNLIKKDNSSQIWFTLDQTLNPIIYKISGFFTGRRYIQFRTSLIITLILIVLVLLVGNQLISIISGLLLKLPF